MKMKWWSTRNANARVDMGSAPRLSYTVLVTNALTDQEKGNAPPRKGILLGSARHSGRSREPLRVNTGGRNPAQLTTITPKSFSSHAAGVMLIVALGYADRTALALVRSGVPVLGARKIPRSRHSTYPDPRILAVSQPDSVPVVLAEGTPPACPRERPRAGDEGKRAPRARCRTRAGGHWKRRALK